MTPLTPRQHEVLAFIAQYWEGHRFSPTFEEIQLGVGMSSKSNVHSALRGLEERGAIRRVKYRARTIEIVADVPCHQLLVEVVVHFKQNKFLWHTDRIAERIRAYVEARP